MRVIPWYKMYDFVTSQPPGREIELKHILSGYSLYLEDVPNVLISWAVSFPMYVPDSTLSKWNSQSQLQEVTTFGQIKESMDNYMDNQFRESGFEVYLP